MDTAGKQRIHFEELEEPITKDGPHETTAHLPLNAAQRAIWVAHHFEPDSPAYNVGQYTELLGCLDPALFAVAARQVVVQTEALRLRFYDSPDGPMQCVVPFANWELSLRDFSDELEPLAEADAWVHAEIARPFDLRSIEVKPLFRWTLLRIRSDRWYWVQVYHHLISDGYSRALIAAAVAKRYTDIVEERQTEEASRTVSVGCPECERCRVSWIASLDGRSCLLAGADEGMARANELVRDRPGSVTAFPASNPSS